MRTTAERLAAAKRRAREMCIRDSSTGAVMVELSVVIVGVVSSDTYGTVVRLILMAGPPEASSMARCQMCIRDSPCRACRYKSAPAR